MSSAPWEPPPALGDRFADDIGPHVGLASLLRKTRYSQPAVAGWGQADTGLKFATIF